MIYNLFIMFDTFYNLFIMLYIFNNLFIIIYNFYKLVTVFYIFIIYLLTNGKHTFGLYCLKLKCKQFFQLNNLYNKQISD